MNTPLAEPPLAEPHEVEPPARPNLFDRPLAELPPPDESLSGFSAADRPRSVLWFALGLVGVALFSAAAMSMIRGQATVLNLVLGLLGIALMAPSAAFFVAREARRNPPL